MLPGHYIANYKKENDALEVKADGTYIHRYEVSEGMEKIDTQHWTFEYDDGEPMITFENFSFGSSGYGTKQPGFWVVRVEKTWKTFPALY